LKAIKDKDNEEYRQGELKLNPNLKDDIIFLKKKMANLEEYNPHFEYKVEEMEKPKEAPRRKRSCISFWTVELDHIPQPTNV
jgi:hypothetical protein